MTFEPKRRKAERGNAHCRSCCSLMEKGEEGVFWFSSANRGMNIILCLDCCAKIGELAEMKEAT